MRIETEQDSGSCYPYDQLERSESSVRIETPNTRIGLGYFLAELERSESSVRIETILDLKCQEKNLKLERSESSVRIETSR